jgi:hypothetical protein
LAEDVETMGLALWECVGRPDACNMGMLLVLRSRVCAGPGKPWCAWDRSGGVGIGCISDTAD